jgi:hypothetical protein
MAMNKEGRQGQEQCSFALRPTTFQEVDLDATAHGPNPKS